MNNKLYGEKKEEVKIEPEEFLSAGVDKKYISFSKDKSKITYSELDKTYSFKNPEEKVRASFYVELIEKYSYPENRLDTEVVVPRRIPTDKADIVIYEDDEKKYPYFVLHLLKTNFYKKLMIQKTRGATPSRRRLSHKDFSELPFPKIDIEIQNKIAEEVKRRMQKAESLQKEAKQFLEEAKRKVEGIIIGEIDKNR